MGDGGVMGLGVGLGLGFSVGSPAFSPAQIGNVVWSLSATFGVLDASGNPATNGVAVKTWKDGSGALDSNRDAVQATSGSRPTFVAASSVLNGKPTIALSGSQFLATGTWSVALAQPCTIFAVAKSAIVDGSNDLQLLDGIDGSNRIALLGNSVASSVLALYCGSGPVNSAAGVNTAFAAVVVCNGASSKLYVNKKSSPATGDAGAEGIAGATVGARFTSFGTVHDWDGEIAELWAFNKILSATEAGKLLDYAGTRYALSIAA